MSIQRPFDPLVFDLNPVFDTHSLAGIWAERGEQSEAWSQIPSQVWTFSRRVFSLRPVYSTQTAAGLWDERSKQSETWANL